MNQRYAVVLAAGQGTRMKSKLYKVMHEVAGKPMVGHVVEQAEKAQADQIVTIVGVGAETVQAYLGDRCDYALQEEQLGTAHAVLQAKELLENKEGTTMVVCGDTPLLTAETLDSVYRFHEEKEAKATVLSAYNEDPTGYGRIIRGENGEVEKIVEQKDASAEEAAVKEINTGTYCFDNQALFEALAAVGNDNAQGEYYLPDVIEILKAKGETVAAFQLEDQTESLGVNDRLALSQAEGFMRERINRRHMKNGVTLIDPAATYIESDVVIGADTVVEPGVYLKGQTTIGEDCIIHAHSVIEDSTIGNGVTVTSSTIEQSVMEDQTDIGPNSHLRPQSLVKEGAHIGNFVEVKKSTIGRRSKAGHLTYIGDAEIGENVNLGCGTVFVNYNGKDKNKVIVKDNSFIGCNTNLIAPVTVEEDTYVAAGSTITDDVPKDALAIARARQVNKEGYAAKLRKK